MVMKGDNMCENLTNIWHKMPSITLALFDTIVVVIGTFFG